MAVVINEFEVVTGESGSAQPSNASAENNAGEKSPPSPWEIERWLEEQIERGERVRAH